MKPWQYVVMAPLPTFTSAADTLSTYFLLVTFLVTLLVLVGSFFMARMLTRPIIRLKEVADRISLGDLEAKIDIQSHDEIGELADAVSRMQASLNAAIERLRARRSTGNR